jgi:tetratricopeptide (TPR) repeat protein
MPLGIELAAAWVDVLPPEEIAAETQHSLDFLAADWRDVPARHRSIRAVLDASWQRLSPAEQDAFPQLSVFRGGFTRQAAQEVTGAHLRALVALADKSLLQYEQARDRYQIHELLRQYGSDKSGTYPDREAAVQDRHSDYYCAWLEERGVELRGARQQAALAEIEADIENAQAAWRWAVAQRPVVAVDQAMDGLCGFFELRNRYRDGQAASQLAAAELAPSGVSPPPTAPGDAQRALAKALAWQGRFSQMLALTEVASPLLEQSVALLEGPALADQDTRAIRALVTRPIVRSDPQMGDPEKLRRRFEQSLTLYKALGDQWGVADAFFGLGDLANKSGAYGHAKQQFEESLALYQALGNQWHVAHALNKLGWVARGRGAYDQARGLWGESLALSQTQNNLRGMAGALSFLGWLAVFQGQFEEGAKWLQQSIAIRREVGDRNRRAFGLGALARAHCLSGKFSQADAALEEAVAICQDLGHPVLLAHIITRRAQLEVHIGRYEDARTHAQMALTLVPDVRAAELPDPMVQRVLGWAAMAQEAYAEAAQWLGESVAIFRSRRDVHSREWLAWSLAALGRAAHGLGNRSEAQGHLFEALGIAVDMGAFIPLLHLMPIIPVVLADAGEVERAVELYALAESHPFVANSQLFKDIAGRFVEAAAATLASDVVAATWERGRALDWWDTAAELLDKLPKLGWRG